MHLAVFTSPGPLLFQLGPFSLRWYGLLIAVAVLLGLMLATRLGRQRGIEPAMIADLLPILVLAAVIGARVYYVVFEWRQYQLNWLDALAIWRGGIAIHGALLGGSLAVILYCRWRKLAFWNLLDVLVPSVALGQAIGRWGNFFNSETVSGGFKGFITALPVWGFYRGWAANTLKVVPQNSIRFVTYEALKALLGVQRAKTDT